MPPRPRRSSSYPVLGLLSVSSWTTYELAQQVRRSLSWFWPRAERQLYAEPKRLVAEGLATATEEFTGRRRSTVYAITEQGRAALAEWLGERPAPPATESEAIVKVFFADAGSLAQLQGTLDAVEEEARERLQRLGELLTREPRFPARAHLGALTLALHLETEGAVLSWARWARDQVAVWESTQDPGAWDVADVRRRLAEAVAGVTP